MGIYSSAPTELAPIRSEVPAKSALMADLFWSGSSWDLNLPIILHRDLIRDTKRGEGSVWYDRSIIFPESDTNENPSDAVDHMATAVGGALLA